MSSVPLDKTASELEAPVLPGEEFRDRNPRRVLSPEDLAPLIRLSDAKSAWSLAQTYGLVALTALLGCYGLSLHSWPGALLVAVCVLLMGCWQHWLAIISHESTHYRLFASRALNDLLGRLSGMLIGVSTFSYRIVHRLHHNHLYEPVDPDMALMAGYPRGKMYLVKKLLKDAAGLTAWRNYLYFFGAPAQNRQTGVAQKPLSDTTSRLRDVALTDRWIVVAFHVLLLIAMFAIGYGVPYLILWILPAITVQAVILRLRAVLEHGAPSDTGTPLGAARTNTELPLWAKVSLFPHHVNFHLEHHLYPAVPHYHLPALHEKLKAAGVLDHAEVRTFRDTMARVFAERRPAAA